MKKLGDHFAALGFNKEAPIESQKAFIKYLVRDANRQEFKRKSFNKKVKLETEKPTPVTQKNAKPNEQLSFDFEKLHAKGRNKVS